MRIKKKEKIFEIVKRSVIASRILRQVSTQKKNEALRKIADFLDEKAGEIKFKNEIDVEAARVDNLSESLIDRLILNDERLKSMTDGIREVACLNDPLGVIMEECWGIRIVIICISM